MKLIRRFRRSIAALSGGSQYRTQVRSPGRIVCVPSMLIVAFLFVAAETIASDTILVVPTRDSGAYQEFIQSFENSLAAGKGGKNVAIRTIESSSLTKASYDELYSQLRLIVTVGADAAQKVLELNPSAPVLSTLIPRSSYSLLTSRRAQKKNSAIYLDQPLARRLDLVEVLLPQKKTISVVLGPSTRNLETELKATASKRGFVVKIETMKASQRLVGPLNRALEDSDAFLAVADPVVSNRRTVQNLLLTTYRQRVPVIGYSRAYVRAGALAAVFSTPTQIGKQTGEMVGELLRRGNWSLPKPQYPKYFSVEVNDQVAKSLGISAPRVADIEGSLKRSQGVLP